MAAQEPCIAPVLVFVHPTGFADDVVAALRRNGLPVVHGRSPHLPDDSQDRSIDSAIVILDTVATESLFTERISCRSRKRLKACEDDTCRSAVTTALAHGAHRVLLICDGRRLTCGQRLRALRWLRHVANRIRYESAINGVDGILALYAISDTDDDVHRLATAIAAWHNGKESNDPEDAKRVTTLGSVDGDQHRRRPTPQSRSGRRTAGRSRLHAA